MVPQNRPNSTNPMVLLFADDGALYVCDFGNHCVRKINLDQGLFSFPLLSFMRNARNRIIFESHIQDTNKRKKEKRKNILFFFLSLSVSFFLFFPILYYFFLSFSIICGFFSLFFYFFLFSIFFLAF